MYRVDGNDVWWGIADTTLLGKAEDALIRQSKATSFQVEEETTIIIVLSRFLNYFQGIVTLVPGALAPRGSASE